MPLEPGDLPSLQGISYGLDSPTLEDQGVANQLVPVVKMKGRILRYFADGSPAQIASDFSSEGLDLMTALSSLSVAKRLEILEPIMTEIAFAQAGISLDE